ncbi:hypothetical protein O3Q52_47785, partial [Streptomyces sp. ActVer]|nr:hypothetical protein [Streptomyces sp. ActVer]
ADQQCREEIGVRAGQRAAALLHGEREHPTRVQNVPPRGRRGRPALIATVAVVVAALATAATALVLNLRDSDGDDNKAKGSGVSASGTATSPSAKQTPTPESTPAPSKEASQPAASPSEEATTTPATGGRWIAQLFSEPVGSGTATRDQRLAAIRKSVPEAVYVRSDDYASLRPGFWVIYAPGPFTDGRAALSFCADRGRTTSTTCVGRYLSTASADYSLQCSPPAASPKGRCTRQ